VLRGRHRHQGDQARVHRPPALAALIAEPLSGATNLGWCHRDGLAGRQRALRLGVGRVESLDRHLVHGDVVGGADMSLDTE